MLWHSILPKAGESKDTDQVKNIIERERHLGAIPDAFSNISQQEEGRFFTIEYRYRRRRRLILTDFKIVTAMDVRM